MLTSVQAQNTQVPCFSMQVANYTICAHPLAIGCPPTEHNANTPISLNRKIVSMLQDPCGLLFGWAFCCQKVCAKNELGYVDMKPGHGWSTTILRCMINPWFESLPSPLTTPSWVITTTTLQCQLSYSWQVEHKLCCNTMKRIALKNTYIIIIWYKLMLGKQLFSSDHTEKLQKTVTLLQHITQSAQSGWEPNCVPHTVPYAISHKLYVSPWACPWVALQTASKFIYPAPEVTLVLLLLLVNNLQQLEVLKELVCLTSVCIMLPRQLELSDLFLVESGQSLCLFFCELTPQNVGRCSESSTSFAAEPDQLFLMDHPRSTKIMAGIAAVLPVWV